MRLAPRPVAGLLREDNPSRAHLVPTGPLAELIAACLVVAGALLVVWAYRTAPTAGIQSYDPVFWFGMLLAYLAIAWHAISGRNTVIWLGLLGIFTLLPKFWMSPGGPIYFDETAHFALLRNTISAGMLFQHTPLLPIGTFYPGMESAAAAIHWLTGLSAWDSTLTLIATVHCLLPVQVYYIARALPVPPRWAAVAGLVYAANPSFIYNDVQFAYESFAILLMLTIVRLYVGALAAERAGGRTWRRSLSSSLLIALISFACVVTHHLTSLTGIVVLLAGALFLKPIAGLADRRGGWRRLFVRWMPVLTLAVTFVLWVAFVAPQTVPYLFPNVSGTAAQLIALAGGSKDSGVARTIFSHSAAPIYEQAAAIAGPILIAVAFIVAIILWLRNPSRRLNFLWALVLTAAYLVSLPLTLTSEGVNGAHRTWATTFVGVALLPAALVQLSKAEKRRHTVATTATTVLAVLPVALMPAALVLLSKLDKRRPWLKPTGVLAGTALFAVLLVGNVAAGTPIDYRFPGPYRFGSDTLSVTPETLRLAHWVQAHLGTGARVVTDRFTGLALTADADAFTPLQRPTLPISGIWYDRLPPTPNLMSALERQGDEYLAVDVRDAQHPVTAPPPLFFAGEPKQVPGRNISRLAQWPWLRLVYSSAHYRLYRIDYFSYYLWYPSHAHAQ